MTRSIVKNEATATERVGYPIAVYDADGQLISTAPTFAHGTAVAGITGVAKEVEVWNGAAWVEAASNPSELGAASGLFQFQFSQAETNVDSFIAVRLCKTGFARPFYLFVPITPGAELSLDTVYIAGAGTAESPDRTLGGLLRRWGGLIESATGLIGSTVVVLGPNGEELMRISQATQGASHTVSDVSGSES